VGTWSISDMDLRLARPIKRLHGESDVVKDLRRRPRSTTFGVRDRERAEIILLRLDGVGVEAIAERVKIRARAALDKAGAA
jgi:hypothetical protein